MTAALVIAVLVATGAAIFMGYRWSQAVAKEKAVSKMTDLQKQVIAKLSEAVDSQAKLTALLKKIDETNDPKALTDIYNSLLR